MYCLRGIDSLGNLCQQSSDALKTAASSDSHFAQLSLKFFFLRSGGMVLASLCLSLAQTSTSTEFVRV